MLWTEADLLFRYCQIMYPERKPLEVLQNAGVEDFRRYIDYCLTNGNYTSQGAIWTRWKFLLCLYQDETGREVEMLVRREMHGVSATINHNGRPPG